MIQLRLDSNFFNRTSSLYVIKIKIVYCYRSTLFIRILSIRVFYNYRNIKPYDQTFICRLVI